VYTVALSNETCIFTLFVTHVIHYTQVTATGAYTPTLSIAGVLAADATAYISVLPGACFEVDPVCAKGVAVTIQVYIEYCV
jgi:hypothetical protein